MNKTRVLAFAALLTGAALSASAQEGALPSQAETQPWSMTWSDPAFEQIAGMLIGSWKTTGAVAQSDGSGEQSEVLMAIAPAGLNELPDALYIETARADSPERPYRSAFLQFYRRQGEIRLRTLEVRGAGNPVLEMLVGLWTVPQFIPQVSRDELIATLDLQFTKSGSGWVGETPYPYPTAVGGAVEMTSRMKIGAGRIETADRGFGADGGVLWGPGEGETYVFERADPWFSARQEKQGVTIVTLKEDAETEPFVAGDRVVFQYSGWVTSGRMFATSRRGNGKPQNYIAPGSMIPGWTFGTAGMSQGDWRKFIVPSDLAYRDRSAANGAIPPNSTLVFEAECVLVSPGEAPLPDNVIRPGERPGGN